METTDLTGREAVNGLRRVSVVAAPSETTVMLELLETDPDSPLGEVGVTFPGDIVQFYSGWNLYDHPHPSRHLHPPRPRSPSSRSTALQPDSSVRMWTGG